MDADPDPEAHARRQRALVKPDVLDTDREDGLFGLARLASLACGTPTALITFVDEEAPWCRTGVAFALPQTSREIAFCAHTALQSDITVVPDATQDHRFRDDPLVAGPAAVRFYAGAPLRTRAGDAIGTICVIDYVPRRLTAEQSEALRILGRQVVAHLELRRPPQPVEPEAGDASGRHPAGDRPGASSPPLEEERYRRHLVELRRWHEVTLDREDRILELKGEVNDLLREAGRPPRYLQNGRPPRA
jgi:hypothetical protein